MVTFLNYSNPTNITGFPEAWDYSSGIMTTAVGMDVYGPLILVMVFFGFYVVGSKYIQQQALLYSSFMTTIVAILLVWGQMLNPFYAFLCSFALMAAAFFMLRDG